MYDCSSVHPAIQFYRSGFQIAKKWQTQHLLILVLCTQSVLRHGGQIHYTLTHTHSSISSLILLMEEASARINQE